MYAVNTIYIHMYIYIYILCVHKHPVIDLPWDPGTPPSTTRISWTRTSRRPMPRGHIFDGDFTKSPIGKTW